METTKIDWEEEFYGLKKMCLKMREKYIFKIYGSTFERGNSLLEVDKYFNGYYLERSTKKIVNNWHFYPGDGERGSNYVQSWEGGWYVQGSLLGACTYLGMFSRFWYLHVPRPVMVSAQTIFSLLLVHIFHILLKPFLAK